MKFTIKLNAWVYRSWLILVLLGLSGCAAIGESNPERLWLKTAMGMIEIELYPQQAPVTVANFLKYVDANAYAGGSFYRVVRADNDNGNPKIQVIQGDVKSGTEQLPAIALETTAVTGLKHLDGTLSMARSDPNTATSSFFICIGAQPGLDFTGKRNPDGQGFAAFGRVVQGMDVVRAINAITETQIEDDAYFKGQMLSAPVLIESLGR